MPGLDERDVCLLEIGFAVGFGEAGGDELEPGLALQPKSKPRAWIWGRMHEKVSSGPGEEGQRVLCHGFASAFLLGPQQPASFSRLVDVSWFQLG